MSYQRKMWPNLIPYPHQWDQKHVLDFDYKNNIHKRIAYHYRLKTRLFMDRVENSSLLSYTNMNYLQNLLNEDWNIYAWA